MDGLRLSLHGLHGYVAKGPSCRVGSLRVTGTAKFGLVTTAARNADL